MKYQARTVKTAAPPMYDPRFRRLVLSPRYDDQANQFFQALEIAWREGAWTIGLDELWYLDKLGLRDAIERLLTQGRSKRITVVCGMQRPAQVTRFALSQATHVLSFGAEGRDTKILAEATSPRFGDMVASLRQYEFAWYHRPDKKLWRGRLQDIERHEVTN